MAAGLAGAGAVRHGWKEYGGEVAAQACGELGGEDHIGAERQVWAVPLDRANGEHSEISADGRLGAQAATKLRERDQLSHRDSRIVPCEGRSAVAVRP
jgi:hypothetical protein